MIFGQSIKVCLSIEPCDMRKSFEGLSTIVINDLGEDVTSRKLYVFCNRVHTRIKLLYWDGTGLWVMTKRLEKGTFHWPKTLQHEQSKAALKPEALEMLLSGIDLRQGMQRAWYEEPRRDE
jgi:transposase